MIILTHITSLHCLRHLGAEVVAQLPRHDFATLGEPFDTPSEAIDRYIGFCNSFGVEPGALHLLYPHGKHPAKCAYIRAHETRKLPSASLVKLADGVYASSPELLFCQLASWGSIYDAIYLAYELCGTYLHPTNESIPLSKRRAFTTKAKLDAFITSRGRFHGKTTALRAAALVRERSASHMESAFAMLFGLPCKLGGLGFPEFEMNWEVRIPKGMQASVGRSKITVDICWPSKKVAFEYDSMQHHNTVEQVAIDTSKRNVLMILNYNVVSFAGMQLRDKSAVLHSAEALTKALGHRSNPRGKDYLKKRHQLEWTAFKDGASIFASKPNARSRRLNPERLVIESRINAE